jgi:hypothetical protein
MPELTLAEYRASDLRLGEMVAGRLGYVHDLFLEFPYEVVEDLPPDPGDLVVIADNKDLGAKFERLAEHTGRAVVVAAGGDGSFRADLLPGGEVPPNLVAAFTINNEVGDRRMVSLPLGVRVERADRFREAARDCDSAWDRLLYVNFSVGALYPRREGRPHIRHRLAKQFEDASWADVDLAPKPRGSDPELRAYYSSMARHRFVLSPEGFGADCYRHWECLYLGTIPIVRASPAMSSFSGLPILFTEDYTEIDEPYLEEQWERLSERRFEIERLTASFYRARFRDCISALSRPRFLCWGFRGTDDEPFLERLERAGSRYV